MSDINQEIKYINIKDLHLWSENPRDPIDINASDYEIISRAINNDKEKWNLDKLLQKMGVYYDFSELPTVVFENNKYIIYDGNRRIALIKCLQNQELYKKSTNQLFCVFSIPDIRNYINLKEVPCNICDKKIALNNIERKHVESGSWQQLERDYFAWRHRGQPKSLFLIINENTKIIENNNKVLNQRFVKEEVLTEKNLNEIGFHINYKTEKIVSNYSNENAKLIVDKIIETIKSEKISTRKNRGELKKAILEHDDRLESIVHSFNNAKSCQEYNVSFDQTSVKNKDKEITRRTPKTKENDILFGKKLILKSGKVNDLYLSIDKIYETNKNDLTVLPIIGMALRLLVEVAARVNFEEENNRQITKQDGCIYNKFLDKVKQNISQQNLNLTSVTQNWLEKSENIEGILGKYAHGDIHYDKSNILKVSYVVADILELYFKKEDKLNV